MAPIDGEVVLTKTCSSFFTGTNIDTVLRNSDIENVIMVGFYTEQCITTAARDAADTFYYTIVVSGRGSGPDPREARNRPGPTSAVSTSTAWPPMR